MKLIAQKDFTLQGKFYLKDKEVKINDFTTIVKLNEQGFIKPLTIQELIEIKEEMNRPKIFKKEE